MAFSFVVLAPVALREPWESHRRTLEKQWKGVVYIGSFMVRRCRHLVAGGTRCSSGRLFAAAVPWRCTCRPLCC